MDMFANIFSMELIDNDLFIDSEPLNAPFRPIQYLGSKLRLVEDIAAIIEKNKVTNTICDLFAGSGVVSHFLSKYYSILSVDIQHYSSILCAALTNGYKFNAVEIDRILIEIEKDEVYSELKKIYTPLIEYEESFITNELKTDQQRLLFADFLDSCSVYTFSNNKQFLTANRKNNDVVKLLMKFEKNFNAASEIAKKTSYCSWYFGGIYFSFKQSIFIDVLLRKIISRKEEKYKEYTSLLAALLSTLSEIVSTVGKQFAQPMKLRDRNNNPKKLLSSRIVRDRKYSVPDIFRKWVSLYTTYSNDNPNCASYYSDYRQFLNTYEGSIGCFYADPPYTIDHYSRFYHVLETISLYDYPQLEEMNKKDQGKVIMKGLYRNNRHQSPFSIPSQVEPAFSNLFERTSKFNCPLLLSYSPFEEDSDDRPRLIKIERLQELAYKFYDTVELLEVKEHKHRKLNKTDFNTESNVKGEIFLLCK